MVMSGFNNSYGLGWGSPPQVGMTVYETSPSEPGVITEILGPDPKFARYAGSGQNPHFRVRVRWLSSGREAARSTNGLHDLDLRIDDLLRQVQEMDALRLRARRGY